MAEWSRWVLLVTVAGASVALLGNGCGSSNQQVAANQTADASAGSGGAGASAGVAGDDTGGLAAASVPCASDKACSPSNQLCDPNRNLCVDCLTDPDCGSKQTCNAGVCTSYTS